jgi:menaquinol-cytochrome c reductase iron-sulfur subunit
MDSPPLPAEDTAPGPEQRRGFLAQAIAVVAGGIALLVPGAVAVAAWLNPLRLKSQAGEFRKLASLAGLPDDGTPRKIPVIADRTDAWNRFPREPIGAVFLRRTGENQVEAFQVVCPHAGCTIRYETTPEGGKFFCPCHAASFALDGQRLDSTSSSPRDMDSLEVEIRNQEEVWVKFQDFKTGTAKKEAKA